MEQKGGTVKKRISATLIGLLLAAGLVTSGIDAVMVEIPAGSFHRADRKLVKVDAFSLLNTEVTWSQFVHVRNWGVKNGYDFEEGIGQENRPAQNINWYDAVKFCNALSEMSGRKPACYLDREHKAVYRKGRVDLNADQVDWRGNGFRLPTEAEWEYACRAGTTTPYYWGNAPDHDYAVFHVWGTREIFGGPLPVASKKPNLFGLYDMAGNMEEWVFDRYSIEYRGVGIDNPKGAAAGSMRVLRGGGFVIDRIFTADSRHPTMPWQIGCDIGFRVASGMPAVDPGALVEAPPLPPSPSDLKPYAKPHVLLDIRPDTDQASCERLLPFLDLTCPPLAPVGKAYETGDYAGALRLLRDFYLKRFRESGILDVSPLVRQEELDPWVELLLKKEGRPLIFSGPDCEQISRGDWGWDCAITLKLAQLYRQTREKRYLDALIYYWNEYALRGKPEWNRQTIIERSEFGIPMNSFYSYIGFDCANIMQLAQSFAVALKQCSPEEIPPRVFANALHCMIVDLLPPGLQDNREAVSNQVWGNATAILEFATLFPEVKFSGELKAEAEYRLTHFAASTILPDGGDREYSLGYNTTLFRYLDTLFKLYERPFPPWLRKLERQGLYRRYLFLSVFSPFITLPGVGNVSCTDTRHRRTLRQWEKAGVCRPFAAIASYQLNAGRKEKGRRPEPPFCSVAFPYSGYYVLRDGWRSDDNYLFLRSSGRGLGHNHHDNNNIQLASGGAWLLIDAGTPSYGPNFLPPEQRKYTDYFGELRHGSVFHANALSVDGLVQKNTAESEFAGDGRPRPRRQLVHFSREFDLVEGIYNGEYAPETPLTDQVIEERVRAYGINEMAEAVRYNLALQQAQCPPVRVTHRRKVLFLREAGFYVLLDEVTGEGREFTQTWNFPPPSSVTNRDPSDELYYGKASSGYCPGEVRSSEAGKWIVTVSRSRPNLAILNFTPHPVRYRRYFGGKFPFRGWYSYGFYSERVPAVLMTGSWYGRTPMVTVLRPLKKLSPGSFQPETALKNFSDRSEGNISGFRFDDGRCQVELRVSRLPRLLHVPQGEAEAQTLLVIRSVSGKISGMVLGGKAITIGGRRHSPVAENVEFVLDKSGFRQVPIRVPENFKWRDDGKGQLVPAYR